MTCILFVNMCVMCPTWCIHMWHGVTAGNGKYYYYLKRSVIMNSPVTLITATGHML